MAPASPVVKKVTKAARASKRKVKPEVDIIEAPVEKRLKRFKTHPGSGVPERIHRALSQRMYLINQEDSSASANDLGRKFAVLGSTGNVYEVNINKLPSCNCPDCARGNLCKHIVFVMVKVLQVPQNSELVYQTALLQSELMEIFTNAPMPTEAVVARTEVVDAYKKEVEGEEEAEEKKEEPTAVNDKVIEGECPVCFESLTTNEPVDSCAACKNYVHKDCLKNWLAVKATCCYCRAPWRSFGATEAPAAGPSAGTGSSAGGREGYLNLGTQQGLPGRRDTSTYNHYGSRYRYGYRYGYRADDYGY